MLRKLLNVILILVFVPSPVFAQHGADPQLVAEINKIKAIDNHAHPLRYVAEGDKPDDEYDALPLEGIDPFPLPLRLSTENREFIGAWKHFYSSGHKEESSAATGAELSKLGARSTQHRNHVC
jgi:hypothetical protein